MAYRMPSYPRNGEVEIAFANQRQNIALYVLRAVINAHRDDLQGLGLGRG
jgi:hypothetical protein